MACGDRSRVAQSLARSTEIQQLRLIPNISFQIPALINGLNSGSIVHWFGPKKRTGSKLPDGASQSLEMRSPRCARVCEKIFFRRVSAHLDLTSVLSTTIDRARCAAAFRYKQSSRLGVANSYWKRGAPTARGRLFSFILYAARFSEIN